jgi:hypothetical protein
MNAFTLPPKWDDAAAALRELEPQAPKGLKPLMIQAAQELEAWKKVGEDAARRLEEAASVRIGQMDSHSRVDEIQRGVKSTMLELARTFRELG